MTKPPIFIELCAGTAALSLRLQGGPKAKPPVSRMGAKTGYADAILAVLGLYPGQGAESYLWCEPDDGVRGLLMAYPQPEVLRAAAAILRGWKDEEPRALWERLRAELKAGASVEGAEGVARYVVVKGNSVFGKDGFASQKKTGAGGIRCPHSVEDFAERLDAAPTWPPVTLAADARTMTPPKLPDGVIAYMDPPYLDTTGYNHDLPRAEVVRMARLWADAGATVCISEAEPIPELMADGWHAVEISATRKGATRTFTGQQKMAKKKQPAEWLTLSRPPSFVPRVTLDLFGGDR